MYKRQILGTLAGEIHICMSPVAKDVVIHLINLCHDEDVYKRQAKEGKHTILNL